MCEMPDASESKVARVRPSVRLSVRPSGSFFRTELVLGAKKGKQSIGASEREGPRDVEHRRRHGLLNRERGRLGLPCPGPGRVVKFCINPPSPSFRLHSILFWMPPLREKVIPHSDVVLSRLGRARRL